jgi:hypothetical protein
VPLLDALVCFEVVDVGEEDVEAREGVGGGTEGWRSAGATEGSEV